MICLLHISRVNQLEIANSSKFACTMGDYMYAEETPGTAGQGGLKGNQL